MNDDLKSEEIEKKQEKLSKEELKELKRLKHEPAKAVANKLISIPVNILINLYQYIKSIFVYVYFYLYIHLYEFKKWSKYCLIFVSCLLTVMFFVKDEDINYFIILSMILIGYLFVYLCCKIYYSLFGRDLINEEEARLTVIFIEQKFPHIAKFFGPTGVGKDSTGSAITTIIASMLQRTLGEEIEELRKKLYMFNMRYVDIHLELQFLNYLNQNVWERYTYFKNILKLNDCFLLNYYSNKWDCEGMINDWQLWSKDIMGYKSYLVFNDDVNPKHFLELLFDYCIKWVRYNKVMNYVLSNQPFLERPGLSAKLWSFDFSKTQSGKPFEEGSGADKKYFEERIFYPFCERLVVYETEVGAYYYNKDEAMKDEVFNGGVRNSKAFNRHLYGEYYYHFQFDQKANRAMKELRDLDHAYIGIIDRRKFDGGGKRISLINSYEGLIDFFSTEEVTDRKNLKLDYKKKIEVERLQRIVELEQKAKTKEKYNNKIKKIEASCYEDYSNMTHKIRAKKTNLLALKGRLKNSGFIKTQLSISDGEYTSGDAPIYTVSQLLQDDQPLWRRSFRTELTFRIKDCYGHYDTHFLKAAGYARAAKSEINILDVPNWPLSLKMSKDAMLYMGYPNAYGLFNITPKDIRLAKYSLEQMQPEELVKLPRGRK